ncbi:hypothetical protein [Acidovorax sp. GW101-3H11]|uniref:hypothetical protein n=1 Tax=Acidovorax sp. GW101-3H11 TaxID=1813946 RepID=UPI0012FFC4F8|nr:hypothetical protein [Acidovorax sp. GW101-3H11]
MKRGLTQQEAMAYVGVKRRTWEANWAPHLTGIHQGVCLIYDRQDLDKLFDAMKAEAAGEQQPTEQDAANDSAHNAARNGRPEQKGRNTWAKALGVSTPTKATTPGKLTSGGGARDFASAVSLVMKKRKSG